MKTIMAVVRPLWCVMQRVTALPQLSLQMYLGACDGCSVLLNCLFVPIPVTDGTF